jgi:radical SAM protein with 4Fe4S-binding SPASM domain
MDNQQWKKRDWDWHKTITKKCVAPWHSLTIEWDGEVYADAVAFKPYGSIYENTLSELWQSKRAVELRKTWSKGIPDNEICNSCIRKEQTVGSSRRQYFYRNLPSELLKTATYDPNEKPNIWYLEINSSNKCNLKCRMCNGQVSSSWVKEEKQLAKITPSWMPKRKIGKYSKVDFDVIKNVLEKKEYFKDLQFLKLTGGEPLMEEQNYQLMEQFIEWDIAKNIMLDINTNGTFMNERLVNIVKHFKLVKLHISLEGTGELYQYIRGGENFTLDQLETNILEFNKLPNTVIIYTVTVQIYNIFNIVDIWDWYLNIRKPTNEIYFKNVVVNPPHLNFQILPNKLKLKAYETMKKANLPQGDYTDINDVTQGDIGFSNIIKNLQNLDTYNEKHLKEFVQFTKDIDSLRKTDVRKIIPQLSELFEEVYEARA